MHPSRFTARFWRRIFAFIVDSFVLGAVGVALGFGFFDAFAALGEQGRWIGFVVAAMYFGVMNSRIGGGQTLGKRLLGIEVINASGEHISVARSLVRYAILGFAFELNFAVLPASAALSAMAVVLGILAVMIVVTTGYLFVFNTRSRRTLHDFVVGTYVVNKGGSGEAPSYPFWRGHVVILMFVAALFAAVGSVAAGKIKSLTPGLSDAYAAVLATGKVRSAGLFVGNRWESRNGHRSTVSFVTCTAVWKHRPADYAVDAAEIAAVVLKNYPVANEKDAIVIQITYGYNIGIAHGSISQHFEHTPAEWKALIAGFNPAPKVT